MPSFSQTISHPFSRMKNGLVELQKMTPAYVKNDGVGGLTVDPVLYRTTFGPRTPSDDGGNTDEANQPGIRVEVIGDDGSTINANSNATLKGDVRIGYGTTITAGTSISSFSASGSFKIGSHTATYTSKNDGTKTFSGVTWDTATDHSEYGQYMVAPTQLRQGTTGTYTLTISGSGTYTPKATLTYGNRTFEWLMIAPSTEQDSGTSFDLEAYSNGEISQQARASKADFAGSPAPISEVSSSVFEGGWLEHHGPFPVWMTVQEMAEMIDSYRNVGGYDQRKPSWLPHGIPLGASGHANQNIGMGGDPRSVVTSDSPSSGSDRGVPGSEVADGNDDTDHLGIRATVFMPMMLDNNQSSRRIPNADISFSYPWSDDFDQSDPVGDQGIAIGYKHQGITRYDHDPKGTKVASVGSDFWKTVGFSGDHLKGAVGAWSMWKQMVNWSGTLDSYSIPPDSVSPSTMSNSFGYSNADQGLDHSAAIGPKYRMRMALACFLKDGTYTLNNGGALIPYTYDADRAIGGKNTTTLYSVWNGLQGYGDNPASNLEHDCSAQIYPMFDFVQGPICPAAQGNNFDAEVLEGFHTVWPFHTNEPNTVGGPGVGPGMSGWGQDGVTNPRQFLVRPNPMRSPVFAAKTVNQNLYIYIGANTSVASENKWYGGQGQAIYLSGLDGALGTDGTHARTRWNAKDDTGWEDSTIAAGLDHNGWWRVNFSSSLLFGDPLSTGTSRFYQYIVVRRALITISSTSIYAVGSGCFIQQGLPGGYENSYNAFGIGRQSHFHEFDSGIGYVYEVKPGFSSGFIAGLSQPDSNVPVGGSTDSTYPGRPTLYKPIQPNGREKIATSNEPTERSISIRKEGDDFFLTAPTITNKGGGSLRIPPPVGWDIAENYYSATLGTRPSSGTSLNVTGKQRDHERETNDVGQARINARWAFRGVHIPFWSFIDPASGDHAWDYVKPTNYKTSSATDGVNETWLFGRNRPWPPHERIGTRAAYSPSLLADVGRTDTETNPALRIDIPANGGWNVSATGDYLASGEETTKYGVTEMGCSPVWLDMTMKAHIPIQQNRLIIIDFDDGVNWGPSGRHSMVAHGGGRYDLHGFGFYPVWDGDGDQTHPTATSSFAMGSDSLTPANQTFTLNRPAVWFWGGSDFWSAAWANSETNLFPIASAGGNNGWGMMGNGKGAGTTQTILEGYHEIRTVFNTGGMTYVLDGSVVGTDATATNEIWGMSIRVADAFGFGAEGAINNKSGNPVYDVRPQLQTSHNDLQIDEMIIRQIPTPAMIPYNVDSMKQSNADAYRYTGLTVYADHVNASRGMNIKVSIMQPPSKVEEYDPNTYHSVTNLVVGDEVKGMEQFASTAYDGFEDKSLDFIGGVGFLDLKNLPSAAYTNGFVIRFHFIIPDSTQTEYHPINWDQIPIIRSWDIDYDKSPTVTNTVTASTSGDTSDPVTAEVGDVVSFRASLSTPDADRTLDSVKFDFGDGTVTGFLDLPDKTLQSTTFDVAHAYSKAGSFTMKSQTKDDQGNLSNLASTTGITLNVGNSKPIAILRGSPSLVQTSTTVNFDGSSSYVTTTDSAIRIESYILDPGDGSGTVTRTVASFGLANAPIFTHTYSSAGEYEATLTVIDNAGTPTTSDSTSVIIKVLATSTAVDLFANLNTRPSGFSQKRAASLPAVKTLDGTFPQVSDTGQRSNTFVLTGSFLKSTATTDILQMETYLNDGTLLFIEWETTDFDGNASVQRFQGRMTSFDYNRAGGAHGETPYSATFQREE